ncbi:anti-sigma factor domain-containing protein [Lacipirellula parvula]|uniref:Zinc-finger domain-containing protein n=1 Tax=Lacipirellula parvula TaxID=2650471 RepID=A0A5K7XJ73_9BACT|nr:anti-sigma factor [Lacipirellula parvula]BBO36425.1 hypothetical protein PLANPX_6037 [Lacipirellula parvula]
MITCDHCRNELAEHALGHLTAEAAAAVGDHLAACPVCRHEAAAIVAAWSALPMTLEPVAPPADLFDRITNRLEDWPQGSKSHPAQRSLNPSTNSAEKRATAARRLSARQRLASYALAASVLIGLTASFARLAPSSDHAARKQQIANELLITGARDKARLRSEQVRIVSFHGAQAPETAAAYIIWDLPAQQWHFHATGLPAASAGKSYQLWAADDRGDYFAGPQFTVDQQGEAHVIADFPKLTPGRPSRAIVTLESDAKTSQPSADLVFEAKL